MKGTIFDIQHFSTGDGPGIRTTVFLKGCTLHCSWCHNPESQSFRPEILLNTTRCIGCGACNKVCPAGDAKQVLAFTSRRKDTCLSASAPGLPARTDAESPANAGCLACAPVCPTGCLEVAGKTMGVEEVMAEIRADEAYYRHSGGGITLSGGEPMCQPDFAAALLEKARSIGIHTAVETSGNGAKEDYLAAAPFVNLWLWDIKLMDENLYREHTGGTLSRMLDNLQGLADTGAQIHFRVLLVPGLNDRPEVIAATRSLLERYPDYPREVIPYHLLGNAKREKLGLPEKRFREPARSEVEAFSKSVGCAE